VLIATLASLASACLCLPLPLSRLPLLRVCSSVHVSACRLVSLPCQFDPPCGSVGVRSVVDECQPIADIACYSPPCALLPTLSAHVVRASAEHTDESTQARPTRPPGGTPSRSVASLPLVRRSLPVTEPRHLDGRAGHEPGGARRASQEAHTADPLTRADQTHRANLMGCEWRRE
jgi:hypothetical protein